MTELKIRYPYLHFKADGARVVYQVGFTKRGEIPQKSIESVSFETKGITKAMLRVHGAGTTLVELEMYSHLAQKAADWFNDEVLNHGLLAEGE